MAKSFTLLGYPLGHSLSVPVQEALLKKAKVNATYTLTPAPTLTPDVVSGLKRLDGFSVALPYKQDFIQYLDSWDDNVRILQSVNTVVNDNGRFIGYNTDCLGFERTLHEHGCEIGKKVCVLGIGSMGRMYAIHCALKGADITLGICKRHWKTSGKLMQDIKAVAPRCNVEAQIGEELEGEYDLLINATPVGTFPDVDVSPIPASRLKQAKVVLESTYNPHETMLMRNAMEMGCTVIGGFPMLVWQAAYSQEIWNGTKFSSDDVRTIIAELEKLW